MFCPECGKPNDISAKFCLSCGSSISNVQVTNTSEDLYRAVIGPNNQDYYLRQFEHFDQEGKVSFKWHWPAFFITFYWLLYRKMWINALIYLLLPFILMIPFGVISVIAGNFKDIVDSLSNITYFIVIFLIYPMYANALYYKHCKNKIKQIESSSHDAQRKIGELSGIGGTSNVVFLLLLIFPIIAIIGILAAIAIPAYQDYTTRVKLAQVMVVGDSAEIAFSRYYQEHQKIPANLVDAGFMEKLPPFIEKVSVDQQTGSLNIVMANGALMGKTLQLVPSIQSDKPITWTCMSQDIQDRYLSRACRQKQ
jgi:Tfp pilus assembly protein PilE